MGAAFTPLVFAELAIDNADDLVFGVAPHPLRCGLGLEIGSGKVFPEVNFTLPTIELTEATWPEVRSNYEEIGRQVVARALRLKAPGLVLEFELLPAMTERPEWRAELTQILKGRLVEAHLARAIVAKTDPYERTVAAGKAAVALLHRGRREGRLKLARKEAQWLARIDEALQALPSDWRDLQAELEPQYGHLYDKASYGLA